MGDTSEAVSDRARARRWWVGPACSAPAWFLVAILVWPDRVYRIDLLSHFVPQFGAALLLLGLLLGVRRWGRACAWWVGLAGCALLGWHLGACSGPVAASGARTIRVVQFNAHAEQSANDGAFHQWLKVQDADLVCLIETPWSFASANPWVRERYPYRVEPSMGLAWPNLLLSKFPLELTEMEADKPEHMFSFVARRSVTVTLPAVSNGEKAGVPSRFVWTAMHPVSPRRESSWRKSLEEAARDAGILRRFVDGRRASGAGAEVLVTGDFNAAPTGRLHNLFGRITGFTGWCPNFGGGTWPASLPSWASVPIDRVWTTPGLQVVSIEVGPRLASDHRPIVATVEVGTRIAEDSGISEPAGSDAR